MNHIANQEDYLRLMYKIYEKQGGRGIRKVDLARELKISKPSVTYMMKKFFKKGIILSDTYSLVLFTSKGLKLAKEITHSYRVIEIFLRDVLGYKSLRKIREEAHILEHAFSENAIRRLDKFLGNPQICPHGDKIHHL